MLIDIYKDIIDVYQTSREWTIFKTKRLVNLTKNKIEKFYYLPGNQLFAFQTQNEIKLINPKSNTNELSIKYMTDKNKEETVYDKMCRTICENPSETTGDIPFKIVKNIKLDNIFYSDIMTFNDIRPSSLDFVIVIQKGQTNKSIINKQLNIIISL